MLKTLLLRLLATKFLKVLAIEVVEVIVKRTDNTLDDEFFAAFKRAVEQA